MHPTPDTYGRGVGPAGSGDVRLQADADLVAATRDAPSADDGDRARRELVRRYRPLVLARAASMHRDRGPSHDDVVSCGWVGLLKAVRDFDVDRGVPFAAYAQAKVVGEMMRWFRDDRYTAHVPRTAHELARTVDTADRELVASLGRTPTAVETAERTGRTPREVETGRRVARVERGRTGRLPPDPPTTGGDDVEARLALLGALRRLDEQDRALLAARYWLDESQRRIGDRIGVSQAQVSRLERRAVDRLRQLMDGPVGPGRSTG